MPAIVATTTPIQPPQTIRRARRESRPAGNIDRQEHDAADEQRERGEERDPVDRVDDADRRAPALAREEPLGERVARP